MQWKEFRKAADGDDGEGGLVGNIWSLMKGRWLRWRRSVDGKIYRISRMFGSW